MAHQFQLSLQIMCYILKFLAKVPVETGPRGDNWEVHHLDNGRCPTTALDTRQGLREKRLVLLLLLLLLLLPPAATRSPRDLHRPPRQIHPAALPPAWSPSWSRRWRGWRPSRPTSAARIWTRTAASAARRPSPSSRAPICRSKSSPRCVPKTLPPIRAFRAPNFRCDLRTW